jgi:hypothetical protein
MARTQFPFSVINQTLNRVTRPLLRSPAHGLLSKRLLLITVTGRRSGRVFTIPVSYLDRGDTILIEPSAPERKVWWRNLRGAGAPVTLRLRGRDRRGHAVATGDEHSGVRVEVRLDPSP